MRAAAFGGPHRILSKNSGARGCGSLQAPQGRTRTARFLAPAPGVRLAARLYSLQYVRDSLTEMLAGLDRLERLVETVTTNNDHRHLTLVEGGDDA